MNVKTKIMNGAVCAVTAVLAIVFTLDDNLGVSEQGLAHIANQEGCRTKAYQCSADVWTVGLGHTAGVEKGDEISLEQAAQWFVDDVAQAENEVKKRLTQTPTQGEYDMMVSFVFNLGVGNFARSTLLKKFNAGDNLGACDEYLRWVYVNGKNCNLAGSNCAGIPKRRAIEKSVCANGW